MNRLYFLIPITFLLCSCSNLKKLHRQKTDKKVEAILFFNKDNKSEHIFRIVNKSKETIPMSSLFNSLGNLITVVSPSGQEYDSGNASGRYTNINPGEFIEINWDLEQLLFSYHFKETGIYHFTWMYKELGINITFDYFYDYEPIRKKIKGE